MSVAIITGASSGIGRRFALQIAESYPVDEYWIIARREDRLQALKTELGGRARILPLDLVTDEGLDALKRALSCAKPNVRFLVNAAGFGYFGRYDELPCEDASRMIDLNVKALVSITTMTLPYMEKGGRIIQMGSASAFTPLAAFNVYAATKAFVLHYTRGLNFEIKSRGVVATCFCPGWIESEFLSRATSREHVTMPRSFKPIMKCRDAVKGCLRASVRGKTLYVTNWFYKLQHIASKLLPLTLLGRVWCRMLRYEEVPKSGEEKL